jgi:hypothetical protein
LVDRSIRCDIAESTGYFVSRDHGGILNVIINNEVYEEISLYRTFPFSKPYEYISIRTKSDEELGIIKNIEKLEKLSKEEAYKELRLRYLIPKVTHILAIEQEPGLWTMELDTDRGKLQLLMRNIHEHIQYTGTERILITDMEGKRCEITEINKLDKHSLRELDKVL